MREIENHHIRQKAAALGESGEDIKFVTNRFTMPGVNSKTSPGLREMIFHGAKRKKSHGNKTMWVAWELDIGLGGRTSHLGTSLNGLKEKAYHPNRKKARKTTAKKDRMSTQENMILA